MTEDIIITIISAGLIIGALFIGHWFRNSKGMKILRTICWPLIKLKDWVDPNYWASEVGESSGLYDKARNSKTRKWVDSYLSKIFQPINNQVDRFSNWWRDLFKEEMIKDMRG